jgi:hypothetical protein
MAMAESAATATATAASVRTSLVRPRVVRIQILIREVAPSAAAVRATTEAPAESPAA